MAKHRNYCNTCTRPLIEYKRTLTQGSLHSLVGLNLLHLEHPNQPYFHYLELIKKYAGSTDYSLLNHFGLIVSNPSECGKWALSDLGRKFLNGEASIPRYLYFYLGKIIKESSERIHFNQVSKTKFNLAEVTQLEESK